MAYKETPRKPIYNAYEAIVKEIVERQLYEEYAVSEINAIDQTLLQQFKAIQNKLLYAKFRSKSD